jgi:hypothetical protein
MLDVFGPAEVFTHANRLRGGIDLADGLAQSSSDAACLLLTLFRQVHRLPGWCPIIGGREFRLGQAPGLIVPPIIFLQRQS